MGTVTGIKELDRIRHELRQLDLSWSSCPVDKRRLKKETERKALETREVQEKQSAAQWWAALDARVVKIIELYCWKDDYGGSTGYKGVLVDVLGEAFAENRKKAEAEVKKLAELEARCKAVPGRLPVVRSSWQPQTVVYASELVCHNGSLVNPIVPPG
jgi:hypothetical protein